jgi:hypothetical protein
VWFNTYGFDVKLKNLPSDNVTPYFSWNALGATFSTGGASIGHVYNRGASYQIINVGMRTSNTATTHIPLNNCVSGVIELMIFI